MDYRKNYTDSIDPHAGGSFIRTSEGAPTTAPKAPSSDDGAETLKRRKLLEELLNLFRDAPSDTALQILSEQLPEDFPNRDTFLAEFSEELDGIQTGNAADAYAARLYAAQRPQPAPAQQPDRADGMTAEFDHSPLEPVPQEPPEEAEPVQDEPTEPAADVAAFAAFIGLLNDEQRQQLRNLLS